MKTTAPLRALLALLAVFALGPPAATAATATKPAAKSATKAKPKAAKRKAAPRKNTTSTRRKRAAPVRARAVATARPVSTNGATGKVVSIAAKPSTYSVKSGQGLDAVARATGVSKEQLVRLNGLKAPYPLRKGQRLKLGATAKSGGKAYVVARGDTLTAIASRFDVTVTELATLNRLKTTSALAAGRRLSLPPGVSDGGVIAAKPPAGPSAMAYAGPAAVRERQVEPGSPTLTPVPAPTQTIAPPINATEVATVGAGRFAWPVHGTVVQNFGSRGANKADDGIDIAAPSGTPVEAAAAGTVLFAGKQIAAYGNYVLIQHDGGFFTAYGHLDRLNVKIGQRVSQGDEIGLSGQTGQASEPQLHFEVLYAARREDKSAPIDPLTVLPKS